MTTQTTLEQCLIEHGFDIPAYTTGKIKRFRAPDKPASNRSAWLKVFDNGNAVFGDWATGEKYSYSQTGERLPKAEYIKLKREQEKERKRYQARLNESYANAALAAQTIINKATPAPYSHPYLVAKGIQPHGALLNYRNALILPVYGTQKPFTNQLQSLQLIYPDSTKRFLGGGKLKGGYHVIQWVDDAPIVICEGYSTGATLAEHYAPFSSVICAFNAGNLINIAKWYRQQYPTIQIVIAGDNDRHTAINTGVEKANQAAIAVSGMVSIPEFNDDETGTDWNDRHTLDNCRLAIVNNKKGDV